MKQSAGISGADSLSAYIRARGRPAFMPYLTVGDPDFQSTVKFAVGMIDAGADLIELGIPFSDPTADGPTIQAAMQRALGRADFSLQSVFGAAREIHAQRPEIPLVMLTYLNPVLAGLLGAPFPKPTGKRSFDAEENLCRFLGECKASGVVGLVIPDLPYDQPEGELLGRLGPQFGVNQILMVAPNSSKRRFREICSRASGFIYYVTSLGVTGTRSSLPPEVSENVERVRKESGLPVFAGFGISSPEQVVSLRALVDGVIVGSLNHRLIEEHGAEAGPALSEATARFVAALQP